MRDALDADGIWAAITDARFAFRIDREAAI
jgi:hypothetical protein